MIKGKTVRTMNDRYTERLIVGGIIILGLTSMVACIVINYLNPTINHPLCAIAAACVGALAGMSLPARSKGDETAVTPPLKPQKP